MADNKVLADVEILDRLVAVAAAYGTGNADSIEVARAARAAIPSLRRAAHEMRESGRERDREARAREARQERGLS